MARYKVKRHLSPEVRAKISASRMGQSGPSAGHWKGGSYICKGYRYIYAPEHPSAIKVGYGYVLEHRLVMEKAIGRLLLRGEAVHHRDGNRLNNDISNLELCSSTGKHFVEHHLKDRDERGRFLCA